MSRHLPGCAGDDYCCGDCLYDGISQPAILERASDWPCDCDLFAAFHRWDCWESAVYRDMVAAHEFNPNWYTQPLSRFWNTWQCVVHGRIGDINGPVHYALCPIGPSVIGEIMQLSTLACEPCKGSGSVGPFTCPKCGGTGFNHASR